MWFVNAGMSPRNHRFPLSCARQDMNVGRVFTFLINAFHFDNWGCAAAALLNVYLQLMCWKKDDITCCSARTGQQAKVDLVQASHWAFPALSLENERKEPGFSCILCEKQGEQRAAQQSQASTSSSNVPQCHCRLLLAHFWFSGIPQGWPSSAPPLATVQAAPHCWDLNCNHQLADNHYWWNYMCRV